MGGRLLLAAMLLGCVPSAPDDIGRGDGGTLDMGPMRTDSEVRPDVPPDAPAEDTGGAVDAPDAGDAPPADITLGACTVRFVPTRDVWDVPGAVRTESFALASDGSTVVIAARPSDGTLSRTDVAVVPVVSGALAWSTVRGSESDRNVLGPIAPTPDGYLVGWSAGDGLHLVPLDGALAATGPGFTHAMLDVQRLVPIGPADVLVGAAGTTQRFRASGEWLGAGAPRATEVAASPLGGLAVHATVRTSPPVRPTIRALDADGSATGDEHAIDLGRPGTMNVALAIGATSGVLVARVGEVTPYLRVTRLELDGTPGLPDFLLPVVVWARPTVLAHREHFVLVFVRVGVIEAHFYDASLALVGTLPILSFDPMDGWPIVWDAVSDGDAVVVAFTRALDRAMPHPLTIARIPCER